MRRLIPFSLLVVLTACPSYDRYGYVSSEKGMMNPDDYAKFGSDQAIAVAVGREFAKGYVNNTLDGYGKQAEAAMAYARKFSQLKSITADTLGHRLVLTFADGWTAQVTPLTDGKRGDDTPNLPKGQ